MLAEFGDVGLMTGDVTINPSATCLVMTTEVCTVAGTAPVNQLTFLVFSDSALNALSRLGDHARSRLGHL
jgi:hypothetical protein